MAKYKWIVAFIFDTILYGTIFYFSKFSNLVLERRFLLSLLVGLGLALVAGLARYLLNPWVNKCKASIKKRSAEKRSGLNNLG